MKFLIVKEVNKIASLQSQLLEIEKKIQKKIKSALEVETSWESKNVVQEKVIDAYDMYDSSYDNKYHMGGLLDRDNIETKMINDNTLRIENIRRDEETGRLVAPIVEFSRGYYSSYLDQIIGPRPFILESYKELKNGKAKLAILKGLRRQGVDCK